MTLKKTEHKWIIFGAVAVCVLIVGIVRFQNKVRTSSDTDQDTIAANKSDLSGPDKITIEEGAVQGKILIKPDIDYQNLNKDESLKKMMGDRKETLGIKKSLDMIVNSDESFKVGDNKVSMQEILKKSNIEKGDVYVRSVGDPGTGLPQKVKEYGIYVVQPNDNIWNIHFNFLKEYYEHKGINLNPKADEPIKKGLSSGVGKILKFSENMVVIYNMVDQKIATNIDLIEPLSKIVVYNMEEVFSLLSKIDYNDINRLQFDGKTIWIPAKK